MTEFFYKHLLPLAITFGMSTAEFWYEEPDLLWAYQKSYIEKTKLEHEKINYTSWLNGLYFYDAFSTALYNSFSGKNSNKMSYPSKPHDFNIKEETKQQKNENLKNKIKNNLKKGQEILKNRKNGETKGQNTK